MASYAENELGRPIPCSRLSLRMVPIPELESLNGDASMSLDNPLLPSAAISQWTSQRDAMSKDGVATKTNLQNQRTILGPPPGCDQTPSHSSACRSSACRSSAIPTTETNSCSILLTPRSMLVSPRTTLHTVNEVTRSASLSASVDSPHLVDVVNDARLKVPYEINAETFEVPRACPDDHLTGEAHYWLPGKSLRIAYISWNMASSVPRTTEVASFGIHPNAHIIVVGTQENGPYLGSNRHQRAWMRTVESECLRDTYTLVGKSHMWAIHIMVFARTRDVARYVSLQETSAVPTGMLGGLGGNKGGVAVALAISLTPIPSTTEGVRNAEKHVPLDSSHEKEPRSGEQRHTCSESSTPKASSKKNSCPTATPKNSTGENPDYLTILCITAHLAAHQGAVRNRNSDYRQIVRRLRVGLRGKHRSKYKKLSNARKMRGIDSGSSTDGELPGSAEDGEVSMLPLPSSGKMTHHLPGEGRRDATNEFDLTLFGGDLNYRINGTRPAIEYIIHHQRNIRSILMNNDQLSLERAKGAVFQGFQEGALLFRPTYKYEVAAGSGLTLDEYNFSNKKNRMPAYCDRVLFKRGLNSIVQRVAIRLYTDVSHLRTSDHRPVVAMFEIRT